MKEYHEFDKKIFVLNEKYGILENFFKEITSRSFLLWFLRILFPFVIERFTNKIFQLEAK